MLPLHLLFGYRLYPGRAFSMWTLRWPAAYHTPPAPTTCRARGRLRRQPCQSALGAVRQPTCQHTRAVGSLPQSSLSV